MEIFLGILIPFLGTALGAAGIYVMRGKMSPLVQKSFLGFAGGVMVAASVWSLLIPAMELCEKMGKMAFVPAASGFAAGILFLLLLDRLIPHLHMGTEKPEGPEKNLKKTTMLVLAVTLHNIPEGLCLGAVFAGLAAQSETVTLAGAYALSVGIALQNFPEGAIVSLPLLGEGMKKSRAFVYGMLSGVVEPVAAGLTLLLAAYITPVLPVLLAFAAGAMIYVVVEELIPEASEGEHSNIGTIGFSAGFLIMMIMDVALG